MSQTLVVTLAVFIGGYLSINHIPRLSNYYDAFKDIYFLLNTNAVLPNLIMIQSVNIFPMWEMFKNLINFNLLPIIIGSGLGSSSVINNYYQGTSELANTNSQFVRLIYEVGVLGTIFFINIFLSIYRKGVSIGLGGTRLYYFFYMMIGANMAHRSVTLFIVAGIILAVIRYEETRRMV